MIKYSDSVFNNEEEVKNFVRECEENFELQLSEAVGSICLKEKLPFITLAGPTCSGKTTASKKIAAMLKERSVDANIISIDDFYYDTEKLKRMSYEKGMTSIVGESGCGKSTVVNMIVGAYRPKSGSVTVGGKKCEEVTRESYYSHLAVVSYNTYIFFHIRAVGNHDAHSK